MTSISKIYYFNSGNDVAAVVDYLKKGNLKAMSFVPISERDIPSYPSPEGRIAIPDEKAVLVWGHGTKHGVSYFFRPNVPYHKSVDDAHMDFGRHRMKKEGGTEVFYHVDGGNHNLTLVLHDDNLLGLEVLGTAINAKDYISKTEKISLRYPSFPILDFIKKRGVVSSRFSPHLLTSFAGQTVHKSIDLDMVEGYPCSMFYAHGRSSYEDVRKNLEELLRRNIVVRFDIGGFSLPETVFKPPHLDLDGFGAYDELVQLYLDYN
jgi:hypothetical protein